MGTAGAVLLTLIGILLAAMIPILLMAFLFSMALGSALLGSGGGVILAMILGFAFLALLIFFVLFLGAWMGLVYPVAAGEATFGFAAVGRAFRLVGKRLWKCIGTFFLLELTVGVASWLLSAIVGGLLSGYAYTFVNLLVSSLLLPISIIGGALLYLDLRITEENYAATLFPEEPDVPAAPAEIAPPAPQSEPAAPPARPAEPPTPQAPAQEEPPAPLEGESEAPVEFEAPSYTAPNYEAPAYGADSPPEQGEGSAPEGGQTEKEEPKE